MHFMALKKSRTSSGVLVYSYFKDGEFTAVKRNAKLLTRYVKGVPFVKLVYKRVRSWISGGSLLV